LSAEISSDKAKHIGLLTANHTCARFRNGTFIVCQVTSIIKIGYVSVTQKDKNVLQTTINFLNLQQVCLVVSWKVEFAKLQFRRNDFNSS